MSPTVKVVLIGDARVGKTSIMESFVNKTFNESYITTIGVDFRFKDIESNSEKVKLQIWDTAGQECFRSIVSAYYRGADVIVFVYDVTHMESFNNISKYIEEAKKYCSDKTPFCLVGNKSDRADSVVSDSDVDSMLNTYNMIYSYKVSAKSNFSTDALFYDIAYKCYKPKINEQKDKNPEIDEVTSELAYISEKLNTICERLKKMKTIPS